MDVIALHQAGFSSAVASLGTSLTPDQARLIARYAPETIICYDADSAGKTAAVRAIELLNQAGVKVKVIKLDGAKDPDEFIRKFGADAFRAKLNRSENHIEYRLSELRSRHNLNVEEERIEYLKAAAALLASVESPVERSVYAARVAEEGGVSADVVEKESARALKKRRRGEIRKEKRELMAPARNIQPKARELKYRNVRSAAAEEGLLALLLKNEELIALTESALSPEDFSSEMLGSVYAELLKLKREGLGAEVQVVLAAIDPAAGEHLVSVIERTMEPEDVSSAVFDYIDIILAERMKDRESGDDLLLKVREKHLSKLKGGGVEE